MLQPTRRKYRKEQKGRNTGLATRGAKVSFGDFGLKATGRGRLTARQIEAAPEAQALALAGGGVGDGQIGVDGLLPVVLAAGGCIGIGTGIILNHIIVGVGDVIICDRHVGITKLYRQRNIVIQSEEICPRGVIV